MAAADEADRIRPRGRVRWARLSLAAAALVLAGIIGGYTGYRAAAGEVFTQQETSDADAFITALSQGGFVDRLSGVPATDDEVSE
jgi:hypothetical protein